MDGNATFLDISDSETCPCFGKTTSEIGIVWKSIIILGEQSIFNRQHLPLRNPTEAAFILCQ